MFDADSHFKVFSGADIGEQVKLGNSEWTVVGRFTSGCDLHGSEALTDFATCNYYLGDGSVSMKRKTWALAYRRPPMAANGR